MLQLSRAEVLFEDRRDAGRKLAQELTQYQNQPVMVLAIPNGGVPVALEVAKALRADLGVVISRKIPLPLSPEAGFGAVTDDGTVILNDALVKDAGLTPEQIDQQVSKVRGDIRQRTLLYQGEEPLPSIRGKTVIIVDDGLASGYTMMAAVASTRRKHPREIIAAAPVGSQIAVEGVRKYADKVVTYATGEMSRFAVASFYRYWHDPPDREVLQCLKEYRLWRFEQRLPRPEREKRPGPPPWR